MASKPKRVRRTKVEMTRERESTWVLFMQAGYALHTTCGWCRGIAHCRGRTRERVACKQCFLMRGSPNDSVYNEIVGIV